MRIEGGSGSFSWFMQRVSGIMLIFGMGVHLLILPLGGKIIQFETVNMRLKTNGWFWFDLILLAGCLYHGLNGLWSILLDFNLKGKAQRIGGLIFLLFGLFLFSYGIMLLIPLSK